MIVPLGETAMRRVIQQYGLALAVLACFVFSSVQATDSGPHKHAEGQYDAATGSYSVVPGDVGMQLPSASASVWLS
jgi:hypothetical protein